MTHEKSRPTVASAEAAVSNGRPHHFIAIAALSRRLRRNGEVAA